MRTTRCLATLLLAAGLLLTVAGCKCTECKDDDDAKAAQPKSDHPTEHPKGEHPK